MSVILLLLISVSIWVSYQYLPKAILLWDESNHMWIATQTAHAIMEGNWAKFFTINWNEYIYPPLQSLLYGFPMAIFGPTYVVARYITLCWFIVGVIFTYTLGKIVKPSNQLTPIIAALLHIFSPFFLIFSFLSQKETLGTALSTLTILIYISADIYMFRRLILTSLSLALVSFTKYNYGILLAGVLLFEESIRFFENKRWKTSLVRLFALTGPIGVVFLLWTLPRIGKITEYITFVNANVHQSLGKSANMLDYILFYPKSIVYSYAPTRIIGVLMLAAFLLAITKFRHRTIRILWFCIAANYVLGIIRYGNVQDRYIATVIPMFFVLASIIWLELINIVTRSIHFQNKFIVPFIALCIIMLSSSVDIVRFPSYLYGLGAYINRSPLFNQPDFHDLWFTYDTTKWATTLPSKDTQTPETILKEVASSIDVTKPIWFVGEANEFSPPLWAYILDFYKRNDRYPPTREYNSYIVVITIQKDSIYYTHDYQSINEWKRLQFVPSENLVHLVKHSYPQVGVTSDIYAVK